MKFTIKPASSLTFAWPVLAAMSLVACGGKSESPNDAPGTAVAAADADLVTLKEGGDVQAGVVATELKPQSAPRWLNAPGEVKANDYRSVRVTTRIPAQVLRRHARLGDQVKAGQVLATLTSVEVAEAQGEAQLKAGEWARVQQLGEAVVGARRFGEARIAAEQARSRLLAYGVAVTGESQPLGEFTLTATQAGTVLRDNFIEGERIEPGRELFYITDESAAWVEASLSPQDAMRVSEGGQARVRVRGQWLQGRVIQKHHLIDEHSRTIPVRIEVKAPDDLLHTGEFVDCRIETGRIDNALIVPNEALYQRDDGSWLAFLQQDATHYRRTPVKILNDLGDSKQIEGIEPGAKVVTRGAFFLHSELSKASFAEEE
jgi:membrane fusion protein, heavy metal efflux system